MLEHKFVKKNICKSAFFLFDGGKTKIQAHALQTKAIKKGLVAVKEKSCLNAANITLWTLTLTLLKATIR